MRTKTEIKNYFIFRGYILKLNRRTEVIENFHSTIPGNKDKQFVIAFSSKPYDYEFLEKLIREGGY